MYFKVFNAHIFLICLDLIEYIGDKLQIYEKLVDKNNCHDGFFSCFFFLPL